MMLGVSVKRLFQVLMLVSVMIIGVMWCDVAYSDIRTQAIVTVYSEGKVMKSYKAVDRGQMDDNCYVFHIRKGAREPEVRVCGTFTVEQVR